MLRLDVGVVRRQYEGWYVSLEIIAEATYPHRPNCRRHRVDYQHDDKHRLGGPRL